MDAPSKGCRGTSPIGVLVLAVSLGACAAGGKAQRGDTAQETQAAAHQERKVQIALDPSLAQGPEHERAAWIAYGMTFADAWRGAWERGALLEMAALELEARRTLLKVAANKAPTEGEAPAGYLPELARVEAAGLLWEYVVAFHAAPGWNLTATEVQGLRLGELDRFIQENMPSHQPQTRAQVRSGSPPPHRMVGAAFVAGGVPKESPEACPDVLARFPGRLRAFKAEADGWPSVVLAPDRVAHLRRALTDPLLAPELRQHGVSLAAPGVGRALFLSGYCFVDAGNPKGAIPVLTLARALNPYSTVVTGELAQALVALKRFDEAMPLLEMNVTVTSDHPCDRARHLRQLGFALIETRRLDEAQLAYEESLRWEPSHKQARVELAYIEKERRKQAAAKEGGLPLPVPPVPSWLVPDNTETVRSECTLKRD